MMQFLNDVWIALNSNNTTLFNLFSIPAGIVEAYLLMNLFSILLDINATSIKKIIYVFTNTISSLISMHFIPSPINVLVNYSIMFILIKYIFKLDLLRTFIALLFSTFVFALLNILLQNLYFMFFSITSEIFMKSTIHRILFLAILYPVILLTCILIKKFKKVKLNLSILDNLDRKTLVISMINLSFGFLTLCIQLIISAYYSDILPMPINILNLILLISFIALNIYSFTRIIKLSTTRRDLQSAEEYNKSLEILYDKVKGFQHDFNNIVSTLDGYIIDNDMDGLKDYFIDVKKDCKITNNLSILNPRIINNPGIYSLLNNKYFKAMNSGVTFEIDYFINLNELHINTYEFSRILGILIDNAIEEAEKCDKKIVKIIFRKEHRNNRTLIIVENTYSNKDVDIEEIFKKGKSGKENHSGIGLWEVKKYVSKSKNLDLFTTKNDIFFKQELSIYD